VQAGHPCAEAITVFALMIGGLFPINSSGPRVAFLLAYSDANGRLLWPNFRSPLLWDLTAIITYVTGSVIYLYLPLIPDLAQLAEHKTPWRRKNVPHSFSGVDRQATPSGMRWNARMKLMACVILAVAISVHTNRCLGFCDGQSRRCGTAPSLAPISWLAPSSAG